HATLRGAAMKRLRSVLVLAAALCGCEQVMRDMYDQPKQKPATASSLFDDHAASRLPPPGSIVRSRGDVAATSSGRLGSEAVDAERRAAGMEALPARPSSDMLLRGAERYAIYCMPCHSPVGDGDGRVVRR